MAFYVTFKNGTEVYGHAGFYNSDRDPMDARVVQLDGDDLLSVLEHTTAKNNGKRVQKFFGPVAQEITCFMFEEWGNNNDQHQSTES